MLNVAIGISIRPSDGKPVIEGYEIYGGAESGETAVLAEVTVGEGMTLDKFLRVGEDIVNNGAACRATSKALRAMQLKYIVLPNVSEGNLFGRVVQTDVLANKNTKNNDSVTSVVLHDRKELEKSRNISVASKKSTKPRCSTRLRDSQAWDA